MNRKSNLYIKWLAFILILGISHQAAAIEEHSVDAGVTQSEPITAADEIHRFSVKLTKAEKEPKVTVQGRRYYRVNEDANYYYGEAQWMSPAAYAEHPIWGEHGQAPSSLENELVRRYEVKTNDPQTVFNAFGYALTVKGKRIKVGTGSGEIVEEDWSSGFTGQAIEAVTPSTEVDGTVYVAGSVTISGTASAGEGVIDGQASPTAFPFSYKVTVQPTNGPAETIEEEERTGPIIHDELAKWDVNAANTDGTRKYPAGETYTVKLTVTPGNEGGAGGEHSIQVRIMDFVLHPNDSDFAQGKAGRIMISTKHDDVYYTTTLTTKNNTPAQMEDGKIKVTAHLSPAAAGEGLKVYFRVIDPDDLSSYEPDTNEDDNFPAGYKGNLTVDNATAEIKTIDGREVAAAETELSFNHVSGNNYKVQASFEADFSSIISESATLVAWKRIYLEIDRMYKKGATITANFTPDADTDPDTLQVDDTSDFFVGDEIILFNRDQPIVETKVISKTSTTLVVEDVPSQTITLPNGQQDQQIFYRLSGVKLKGNNETYNESLSLLKQAFGDETDGSDGGTFVEFNTSVFQGWNTPKYNQFPDYSTSASYATRWRRSFLSRQNFIQLLMSHDVATGRTGVAFSADNISIVFTRYLPTIAEVAELEVHELGHQFEVANNHVDRDDAPTLNWRGNDDCIMSYTNSRYNGIAEFDLDCIYDVRRASDPR